MAAEAIEKEGELTSLDGTRLHWRAWEATSARLAIAIVHGLGEHSGRYARLADALVSRAISCYALDLRGMGRSEGRRGFIERWEDWVQDAAAFYRLIVKRVAGIELVPLGHSFGGVVLTSAVLGHSLRPGRFILCNPAFRAAARTPSWKLSLAKVADRVVPWLSLSNGVDPALLSREKEVVEGYRRDPFVHDRISARLFREWQAAAHQCTERAAEIDVPFLLILSAADGLVDPAAAQRFAERAKGADHTVRLYAGRLHEPFNDLGADEVVSDLAAWLTRSS